MIHKRFILLTVALLLAILSPFTVAAQQTFNAKVVGISDGDTITVLKDKVQIRIRLHGIDSPEKGQAFGTKAKQFTSDMVFGKVVTVKSTDTDRYGRMVAWVFVNQAHEGLVQTKTRCHQGGNAKKGGITKPDAVDPRDGDSNRHGLLGSGESEA